MIRFFACFMFIVVLGHTSSVVAADENSLPQPSAVELAMWEFAVSTGNPGEVRRFIELYPNSIFSDAANDFIKMLDAETAESAPAATETPEPEVAVGQNPEPVETVPQSIAFNQPIAGDTVSAQPRSLQQLSKGSPLFPPVEGLPEEYWKDQNCSNCHEWEKENLCTQGEFFASHEEDVFSRIEHPYGGFFKQALKDWAAQGCL